jgi:hypothetical protein
MEISIMWRDDTPFDTEAVAASSSPTGYLVIGKSKITTDVQVQAQSKPLLDFSYHPRRMGDEGYARDEAFAADLSGDGEMKWREYFGSGLPVFVRDAVWGSALVVVGSIGGTPLWLTGHEHGLTGQEHGIH